jgi:MscS family membrane protein
VNRPLRAGQAAAAPTTSRFGDVPVAVLLCGLAFVLAWAPTAWSQTAEAPPEDPAAKTIETTGEPSPEAAPRAIDPSKPLGPADDLNRGTPMGSMHGFLSAANEHDYERAAGYLDLRRLSAAQRGEGADLARRFKVVLDQSLWVEIAHLSPESAGKPEDGLHAWQERIGFIEMEEGAVPVVLQRVPRAEDGKLVWVVSAETVAAIPDVYAAFEPVWLETFLPAFFLELTLFQVTLWKWLALVALFLGSILFSIMSAGILTSLIGRIASTRLGTFDPRVLLLSRGPIRLALAVIVFALGQRPLGLSIGVSDALVYTEETLLVVAAAWLAFRSIDFTILIIREQAVERGLEGLVPVLVPGARFGKIIIVIFASLAALGTLGVNVTAVVAGLGVGGIAVALAAQKSLEHLFGGFSLVIDQPVRVGDFFSWGDGVGIVEEIGLRSTRIRTLDRTIVTIPNAEFSNLRLENFAKRDALLFRTTIHVRLETTPDQLRGLLTAMRDTLVGHPRITQEPARVRFIGFGDSSLDLEVFAYVDTNDWNEFLGIREDLLLRFMDAIDACGTRIAVPASTTYLAHDAGLDVARQADVEQRISALRGKGELPFPNMAPPQREALYNELDWPPTGSQATSDPEPEPER